MIMNRIQLVGIEVIHSLQVFFFLILLESIIIVLYIHKGYIYGYYMPTTMLYYQGTTSQVLSECYPNYFY
jgi:hypothetical protein